MWWKKLKLLIWKNFLLQRRHQWQTVFEIASPVIFAMFLILLRCLVDPKVKPEMKYQAFNPNYLNMSGKDITKHLTTASRPTNTSTNMKTNTNTNTKAMNISKDAPLDKGPDHSFVGNFAQGDIFEVKTSLGALSDFW